MIFGMILVWPQARGFFDDLENRHPTQPQPRISAQQGEVIAPTYTSSDQQGQIFELKAQRAMSQSAQSMTFENVQGALTPLDGAPLTLQAPKGLIDQKQQSFTLEGGVTVDQPQSYHLSTFSTQMDLETGDIKGQQPITGQTPFGTIEGQSFEINTKTQTLRLKNRARIKFSTTPENPNVANSKMATTRATSPEFNANEP